ncbi:MAG: hypothetical protein WCY30_00175 [Candidatus Neomarinimicrobiota bacterium]|jgi:hypothetical protein
MRKSIGGVIRDKLNQKLASDTFNEIKKYHRVESIKIDNDEWKKSNKKPEIVDLWHQVNKADDMHSDAYSQRFPFHVIDADGVTFNMWGSAMLLAPKIRKILTSLGVKWILV